MSTTTTTSSVEVPSFTLTGLTAAAIANAAASYNAAQLKANPAFVALTPGQYYQQVLLASMHSMQVTQEVMRQLKDPAEGAFVDAVLSAPASKRADLLAITNAPAAS
jgi:hypothetical protein